MSKKYVFTDETAQAFGRTLHRIKALISFGHVVAGELGGFIEKEDNLSHDGDAWVYGNAKVYENAVVRDDAKVFNDAEVSGNAKVFGNAGVYGNVRVIGDAKVYGNAEVCDDAEVSGDARVYGNADVYDDARVSGNAVVYGDAKIRSNAEISSSADYLCFKGLGSENRNTTFFKCKDKSIGVVCGCFEGGLDEFQKKVKSTHGDSKYAKEYLACIEIVKIHFGIEEGHAK